MKNLFRSTLVALGLVLALGLPSAVFAASLQEAAERVARENNARVLSAQTEDRGGQSVHVIRILTREGVVRTVTVPASSGRAAPHTDPRGTPRARDARPQPRERPPPRDRTAPREQQSPWSAPPRSQEAPRSRQERERVREQPQPRLLPDRQRRQERQREQRDFRGPESERRPSRSRDRERDREEERRR